MPDLGYTQAQWTAFLAREFVGSLLNPIRLLRETRARFFERRTQVANLNDATSATAHLTACTLSGVDYGVNTDTEGRLYVRFVANGGNWDVKLFKATGGGAGDEVARATNVAASATGTLAAQNSSGLTGSVTLGATIAAESNDRHQLYVVLDYPARLDKVFTGTDEDVHFSREVLTEGYTRAAARIDQAIAELVAAGNQFGLASDGNPVARGNAFLESNETSMFSDVKDVDSSANVTRIRGGLLTRLKNAMTDETTGGEQDVVKMVPSAAAATFDGANAGAGSVASHTPLEQCPPMRARFVCTKGSDTGDIGREEFRAEYNFTESGDDRVERDTGWVVKQTYQGPFGFGGASGLTLSRTLSKTGDASHLNLATVASGWTITGETNANTDDGVLYWTIVANGSNWDVKWYSASSRLDSVLVAKATNIATGAVFSATEQRGSGLTVNGTVGSAPVTNTQGTVDLQPFSTDNSSGQPDEFEIVVTRAASPGLIQKHVSDTWAAALNSDTSGSESIPDNYVRQGTFVPFIAQDE